MDRIDTSNKEVDLFGAGKHGFRDGDLSLAIFPTYLNAKWFNAAQEELLTIIEGAGVVPDGAVRTQVNRAIKRIAGGNVTTVNAANSPYALTADNAGLVIMDATAGNIVANLPAVNVIAAKLEFCFVRSDATANTVTVNRAGADTFVGGATSFTLTGRGDYRGIAGNVGVLWATTSVAVAQAVKPGTIFAFAGTAAPSGSLLCPTAATTVSRATYAALFAAIGTIWGVGDGATTFGIPWFPADYTPVQANANVGTGTVGSNLSHSHTANASSAAAGGGFATSAGGGSAIFTEASGGAANLAAGHRVLICVQF